MELACKGVDMAFNTQPESMGGMGMWNVRGLVNNSFYRVKQGHVGWMGSDVMDVSCL